MRAELAALKTEVSIRFANGGESMRSDRAKIEALRVELAAKEAELRGRIDGLRPKVPSWIKVAGTALSVLLVLSSLQYWLTSELGDRATHSQVGDRVTEVRKAAKQEADALRAELKSRDEQIEVLRKAIAAQAESLSKHEKQRRH